MAPAAVTEDYYLILEVDQSATPGLIVKSYKRLALKLHPDRNTQQNTTEDFQRLSRAYETLKDESERRKYDLIYPSLRGRTTFSTNTGETNTSSTPNSSGSGISQIAALRMLKQKRLAQWQTSSRTFDPTIFEAERVIRRLKQELETLINIAAAEAAEMAQRNSWGAWILSPVYKRVEDSDEVKAQKDRARQERRVERDMKERRMEGKRAELNAAKASRDRLKADFDAANLRDDTKIQELQNIIWRKESWERQEKEKVEREKRARELREERERQAQRQREAAEALRRQQEAMRLAKQRREEEEARWCQDFIRQYKELRRYQDHCAFATFAEERTYRDDAETCEHGGWWQKIQGRAACPECHDSWTYLLQCPGCAMKACPKCQAAVRPKRPQNTSGRRPRVRMRARSPTYDEYDFY